MATTRNSGFLGAYTLWAREVVRFLRQRNRVMAALATPILFWFMMGAGFGESIRPASLGEGYTYLEYFFPGTILLIVLFTSIFANISIIEDRKTGFLQAVLVSPVPRWSIVLGKILGGMTLSLIQAWLFFLLAPVAGVKVTLIGFIEVSLIMALIGYVVTGLGYLVAWPSQSVQGFHAIMNLFLMPLWLLSGAMFPVEGAARWMQWLMQVNPMYYGLIAIQRCLYDGGHSLLKDRPSMITCLAILGVSGLVLTAACTELTHRVRALKA